MSNKSITIPNRFESLQAIFGDEVRPLIVPIDADLAKLKALRDRARVQNGGLLCFLLGSSGIGKTTTAHSVAIHMPDDFAPVMPVPFDLSVRDVSAWLQKSLPAPTGDQTRIILFDGREVSDDNVGVRQLLATLNQVLRRRSDILFCWPTTDANWQREIRTIAAQVGGGNLAPPESDITVQGPPSGEWPTVLERILLQSGKTTTDVGIASEQIGAACTTAESIGDFLTQISTIVADRITKTQKIKRLPQLIFVITSSGDVVGEANRVRRAGTQALAPEPLLGYSPRSEAGKWWAERNKNHNTHLGYIISLFDARLVTMTASGVVYACMHHGDVDLKAAAANVGARPDKGNAKRTIEVSELYRFLQGAQIPEFTTGRKGAIQDSTLQAYAAIQGMSAKRHKSINIAICGLVQEHLAAFEMDADDFEVPLGRDIITDAVTKFNDQAISFEFHHLSEAQCSASNFSSYIMDKLRNYAWHHQIIPR